MRETVNFVATVARSVNGLAVGTTPAVITRSRVDHLVSKAVAAEPTALAVASLHGDLTYGELDEGATRVADELRRLGVGPGDLVALTAARSPAMVVGALGILKAQAAYVSIDPSYPRERIAFMLSDCGTRVVVESSPDPCVPKVSVMSDPSRPVEAAFMPASDDDPAYVIYTSGSTGSPKGVVVHHASLLNLVRWHQDAFKVSAPDRASLVASPGFDASVWELWPYLVAGASLHIPADRLRRDPVGWRDWLVRNRITVAYAPTAIAERLMELRCPRLLLTRRCWGRSHMTARFPVNLRVETL